MGWLDKEETEILENSRRHRADIQKVLQDVEALQKSVDGISSAVKNSADLVASLSTAVGALSDAAAVVNGKLDKVLAILAPPPAVALRVEAVVINPSGERS